MDALEKQTENKMDQSEQKPIEDYLKKTEHVLLCENQALKMREFFQTELTQLKNDIFGAIRNLEKTIKQNGGG